MRIATGCSVLSALLVFSVACVGGTRAASTARPAPGSATAVLDSLHIDRGRCFGSCPVYSLTVRRNGGLTLRQARMEVHHRLSARRAESLLASAVTAGVLTLPARIREAPGLCPVQATDHASIAITGYRGGRAHRVDHYTGCYVSPSPLRVADELQRLVALQRDVDALAAEVVEAAGH